MTIDLHNHSNYSDGSYSPSKVIENAVRDGLNTVALADHDCTWGLSEAQKRAKELNINFVPAVELSVGVEDDKDKAYEVHILGLFIKPTEHMEEINRYVNDKKDQASYRWAEALRKYKGIDIDVDRDIRKDFKGSISLGAFGVYLLSHGFVNEFREGINILDEMNANGQMNTRYKFGITAAEAIESIHEAGGLAFLAHPFRMRLDEQTMFKRIKEYKDLGLDGLECYYKKYGHNEAEKIKRSLEMASILGMLVSGGSDYHVDTPRGRFASGSGIPDEVYENLLKAKAERQR